MVQTAFDVEEGVGSAAAEEMDDVAGDAWEGHACLASHADHFAAQALTACPLAEEVLAWAMTKVARETAAIADLTQIQVSGVRAVVDTAMVVLPVESCHSQRVASAALAGG